MGRSILTGILSGSLVSAILLAGVSLMLPPPPPPDGASPAAANVDAAPVVAPPATVPPLAEPAEAAQDATGAAGATDEPPAAATADAAPQARTEMADAPAETDVAAPTAEEPAVLPASEAGVPARASPQVAEPVAEPSPAPVDVQPAMMPAGSAKAPDAPVAPGAGTDPVALATGPAGPGTSDAPALPAGAAPPESLPPPDVTASAAAPDLPKPDVSAEAGAGLGPAPAGTFPAAETAPVLMATDEPAPVPQAGEAAAIAPAPRADPAPDAITSAEQPEPAAVPDPTPAAGGAPAGAATVPEPQIVPDRVPTLTPDAPIAGAAPGVAEPPPDSAAPTTDRPPVISFDAPEPPRGVADAPKPGFRNVPGVKVNRLPTIGGSPAADGAAAASELIVKGDEPTGAVGADAAIRRYAAAFDNPRKLPLMSIILIDVGDEAGGLDMASLRTLSFPLTVAVDPARADAAARAAGFREAGFEVAMLAPALPQGASPSDMEVAYQGGRAALPDAVAVIDQPEGGIGKSRQAAEHMVALLKPDGLGLITWAEGLNSVPQIAGEVRLPHAEIWREADTGGARSEAIRRSLDRAAFEAAQSGQVVVAVKSVPESVTALFAWAAEGGKGVALAPVSAVALKAVGG